MDYKRNHYIPISLINSWVIKNKKNIGVYVYDIQRKKDFFCYAKDRRKFTFAAKNNLYVPEINNIRLTSVERWFSRQEKQLSKFLKLINSNENITSNDLKNFVLSVQTLIGLEYRSRFALNKIKEHLIANPCLQKKISDNDYQSIDKLVLENLIHAISNQTHKVMPAKLLVIRLSKSETILCDRPVIDIDNFKCYVVGRRLIIFIKRSDNGVPNIVLGNENNNVIYIINHQSALQARDWIVTSNKCILEKYIKVINSKEYEQNLKKDKITKFKPLHLNSGYSIYK